MEIELTQDQAISILVQGVLFAQSKEIFLTEDSSHLDKAIQVFFKKEEAPIEKI